MPENAVFEHGRTERRFLLAAEQCKTEDARYCDRLLHH